MTGTSPTAQQVAISAAVLAALAAPTALGQPSTATTPTSISERQALMRQITQQQQSVLQQRLTCINRAANPAELERCERGYPVGMPLWRHYGGGGLGGWTCPMW